MKNNTLAVFYAISAVLFWSTAATAFKLTLKSISSLQLLFYSSLFSTIILFPFMLYRHRGRVTDVVSAACLLKSSAAGLLNPFLYYLILFRAYSLLPAQEAQTLNYGWPIVLVILSALLLKQRLHFRTFISLSVSFCGVIIISTHGRPWTLEFSNTAGVILALSSTVIWASYWIINLKDDRENSAKLWLNFCFGTLYSLTALIFSGHPVWIGSSGLAGSVYIGAFEMGITFLLWMKALTCAKKSSDISNLVFLSPFISLLFIRMILKEEIFLSTIFGLVLIISGILLNRISDR